jgi:hypothetical protein
MYSTCTYSICRVWGWDRSQPCTYVSSIFVWIYFSKIVDCQTVRMDYLTNEIIKWKSIAEWGWGRYEERGERENGMGEKTGREMGRGTRWLGRYRGDSTHRDAALKGKE